MRYYFLVFAIAALVTFALTFPVRKLGKKITRNEFRSRDVHSQPIPRIGGVAMLAGVIVSLFIASFIPFFGQEFNTGFEIPSIIIACIFLCIVGFLDDIFNIDWMIKLAAQILAAAFVTMNGVQVLSLPIGGITVGSNRVSIVFTVIVIVAVINAVNFIDGLDGLAAGVTAIGAMAFFYYSWSLLSSQYNYAASACLVTSCLIGICMGFLPHNWNPAKIFMGDTGSQMLGFLFACSALLITGKIDETSANIHAIPAFMPFAIPFLVCLLPLLDMILAVFRRLLRGQSPFSPDRGHIHHRLLDLGHSHRATVVLLYFWTAFFAFGSFIFISTLSGWHSFLILAGISGVILIGTFAPKIFVQPIFTVSEDNVSK